MGSCKWSFVLLCALIEGCLASSEVCLKSDVLEGLLDQLVSCLDFTLQRENQDVLRCPDGWVYFNNSCYFHATGLKTFSEAEILCRSLDAYVVQTETMVENNFVKGYMEKLNDNMFWLGLTDKDTEGTWVWYQRGDAPAYFDWSGNEPNGASIGVNEDCAVMHYSHTYKWIDVPCTSRRSTLCEKNLLKSRIVAPSD